MTNHWRSDVLMEEIGAKFSLCSLSLSQPTNGTFLTLSNKVQKKVVLRIS